MDQNQKDFQTEDGVPEKPEVSFNVQVMLGFVAYVISASCVVFFGGYAFGSGVTFGILIILTIFLHTKYRWKGFAIGVLIGLGPTVLAIGLCFAAFISAGG